MIPAVVINLKRRPDRWASVSAHLAPLDFLHPLERCEAVEAQPPAAGCLLSHAQALRWARDRNWEQVMVLEDDVRFQPDAALTLQALQAELANVSWNVLFGASVRVRPRDLVSHSPHLLALRTPQGLLTGTHCMLYHRRAYDLLIHLLETEAVDPHPFHLDLLLSSRCSNLYLAVPYLALFSEVDTSDVRVGRDTRIDYQNILEAQALALRLI